MRGGGRQSGGVGERLGGDVCTMEGAEQVCGVVRACAGECERADEVKEENERNERRRRRRPNLKPTPFRFRLADCVLSRLRRGCQRLRTSRSTRQKLHCFFLPYSTCSADLTAPRTRVQHTKVDAGWEERRRKGNSQPRRAPNEKKGEKGDNARFREVHLGMLRLELGEHLR